jgi:hypothetical protein
MNITKILVTTSITCIIAMPALAQVSTQPSAMMGNSQSQQQMQKDFKMTKKDFVAQIEKSFDSMDKNHDGVLTMDEISGGKGGMMSSQPPAMPTPATNDVVEQKTEPTQTTKPLTPVTGIAPLGR